MKKGAKIEIAAPGKINLSLHITGKREDGYHELESWMQKVSIFDLITVELTEEKGIKLQCSTEAIPNDRNNIVFKAAEKFIEEYPPAKEFGFFIDLEKNIPIAAGMGGGSSDAGCLLKGLNDLFGKPLKEKKLLEIGLTLGADVPFFVSESSSVLAEGVGEKLTPVPDLEDVTFVIVNPGISVSTKWVYNNFLLTDAHGNCSLSRFREQNSTTFKLDFLYNDLESVTEAKHPVIREIKNILLGFGAHGVLMSGSGPTVFGIFPDFDKKCCNQIDDAVKKMRHRFRNKAYKTRTSAGAWPSG